MKIRVFIVLYLLGVLFVWGVGRYQKTPGYMDAEYYYSTGLQIVEGHGFREPFIWNYLDNPDGLPHPSHGYWMPCTSLFAAFGMAISGLYNFYGARICFIALSGLVSPLTAFLSYQFTGKESSAWISGIFALLPGYYFAYLGTTDTFSIYMVLGALLWIVVGHFDQHNLAAPLQKRIYLSLGILIGLMHLSRADGILLFLAVFLYIGFQTITNKFITSRLLSFFRFLIMITIGYLVIMGPWFIRNYSIFGSPLPTAGIRTLWLTDYDELFSYPYNMLNINYWWSSGLQAIVKVRWWALVQNLQTALAVQGEIFLAPLVIIGLWSLRSEHRIRLGLFSWFITFSFMTLFFPFTGARGGFFHSGSAYQPLFYSIIPTGLDRFVEFGVSVRRWNQRNATTFFCAGLIIFSLIFTVFVSYQRIFGDAINNLKWNASARAYMDLEKELEQLGAKSEDVIMVNNPPGYYSVNKHPAIVVPDSDIDILIKVINRYNARYLILEYNHPLNLDALYIQPIDIMGMKYLTTINDAHIFKVDKASY